MKKKEREHLKEDPFKEFIGKTYETIRSFKREIFIAMIAVIGIAVIVAAISVYNFYSARAESRMFSEVVRIKTDENLSVDQKIEKLKKMDSKGGVTASIDLYIAGFYYEKGDLGKAKEALKKYSSSGVKILNAQKTLLEADILSAENKQKEALDILNKLVSDPKSVLAKDFVLLKMAKIQIKAGQTDTAKTNLSKILDDYPQSAYGFEAKELLDELGS
jgi:predicted negative regulator of RcsB-dependent stress response